MSPFRRYLGTRHKLLLWTLLAVGGGTGVIVQFQDRLVAYAERPVQIGVLVGLWVAVALWMRYRERTAWRRLYTDSPFERQNEADARRPPLQRELKRKTVTVEPFSRGLLRQYGVRVQTYVDGVEGPLDVSITYVGNGGAEEGVKTGNEALDDQFVFEIDSGSNLGRVFDAEVQSALMDVSVPGTLRIERQRVRYEIPFTAVTPDELGRVARAVATVAARMRRLAEKRAL